MVPSLFSSAIILIVTAGTRNMKSHGERKNRVSSPGITVIHYIPLTRENPHEQTINKKENNYDQITCKAAEKTAYLLSENCKTCT